MNADALVKSLLEAEDFDPADEVDRVLGPITLKRFRAWLDEAGLTGYEVKFADWLVEATGVTTGNYSEASAKFDRVVEKISQQGMPYWSLEDSRPEVDRPRRWEIGFLRAYLKENDEDAEDFVRNRDFGYVIRCDYGPGFEDRLHGYYTQRTGNFTYKKDPMCVFFSREDAAPTLSRLQKLHARADVSFRVVPAWSAEWVNLQESADDDDFDPTAEVDRLVAPQEIYADENVKVCIPRTFETFQQAKGDNGYIQVPNPKDKTMPLTVARPEAFFAATKAYGPFYVAHDFKRPLKGGLPPGLVMNFALGKVWKSPENQEVQWKDVVNMFSAEALKSLQNGLGDYFVKEAKQPGKTRLAVSALTHLGRYDDAAKFGRHVARMPGMPFGQSMAVALARQQQKLRTNNRFTRLIGSMGDVLWKKHGCYMLVDDWNDLVPFFAKSSRDFVEKVLSNDLEYYDFGVDVESAFDSASEGNQQVMKQLLIGRNIENDDYTPPITADDAAAMTERELKDILTSDETKGEVDDIRQALCWAADDAYRDAYEMAYWSLIEDEINYAFGGTKASRHSEFVKHGDKNKLAIYVPYAQLEEWLNDWREGHDYEWDGSLFDLAREYVEAIDVDTRHVNADFSDDYFNEQLKYHLGEIGMQPYPGKSDPNQPELFTDDERIEAPEIDAPVTVSVHPPAGQEGVPSRYKHVRDKEAIGYQKVMGSDRVHWHHESMLIVKQLLEDEVDDFLGKLSDGAVVCCLNPLSQERHYYNDDARYPHMWVKDREGATVMSWTQAQDTVRSLQAPDAKGLKLYVEAA